MKILVAFLCWLKIVIPYTSAQDEPAPVTVEQFFELFSNYVNTTKYEEVDTVQVNTLLGSIRGKTVVTEDGMEMNTFLGIPYAQPPVDQLRFQPPRPLYGYKEFEAFTFGNVCVQPAYSLDLLSEGYEGDEDCLFLNIFTKVSNSTMLKPVMFFIHGGGFSGGSAAQYIPASLVKEDVIVVTVNYRLGALGFLNFGNDVAPGNLGLRDQIQALKWVKMMILYFGGNPNKITIFGESAGAMSGHALTMSPKAAGLFSGVIYESGTMLLSREDHKTSRTYRAARGIATHFNCTSKYYDNSMLECLQEIDFKEFVERTSVEARDVNDDASTTWLPGLDMFSRDPVLPHNYLTAMKNGYFNRVPIMTGTVLNDGGLMYPGLEYGKFWEENGPKFLALKSSFNLSETTAEEIMQAKLAKHFYTGKNNNLLETLPDYANMMTDSLFLSPDQKVAELASQYVPVYNYRFTFRGRHSFLPFYLAGRENDFGEETAAAFTSLRPVHADELVYLFALFELGTEEEQQVRATMVKYWTNFAKYGHPSPLMSDNITQWLPYSSDKKYMLLDGEATMESQVEMERMAFWQKIHWNERESKIEEVNIFKRAFLAVMKFFRGH
jgi:carboxylesterase type B